MRDFVLPLICILLIVCGLTGILGVVAYHMNKAVCMASYADVSEEPPQYTIYTKCMIKYHDQWIPSSSFRVM